jgi:hypothetical protein
VPNTRGKLAAAPRDLEATKRRALEILNWMREGYVNVEWKVELARLDQQRAELEATIAAVAAQPPTPSFHPSMARVFAHKVRALADGLEHEELEQRESARSALRGFIDRIVIPPGDGLLQVVGNLGEMLTTAADGRSNSAAVGNGGCGGSPQIVPEALLGGGMNAETRRFLEGFHHVRRSPLIR